MPIPHLIECFHMKQGGHQVSGSYPFHHGLLEAQHQAGDKSVCRKETSSGSLGDPHRWLSAMSFLRAGGGSQDLGFTFPEGANQRCDEDPSRHQQFTSH